MDLQNGNKGKGFFGFGRSRNRGTYLDSTTRPLRRLTPPSELRDQTVANPSQSEERGVDVSDQSSTTNVNQNPQVSSSSLRDLQDSDEHRILYENGTLSFNLIRGRTHNAQDSINGPSSSNQEGNSPLAQDNRNSVERVGSVASSENASVLQSHALEGELEDSNSVQSNPLGDNLEGPSPAETVAENSGHSSHLPRGSGLSNRSEIEPAPLSNNTSYGCDPSQPPAEQPLSELEGESLEEDHSSLQAELESEGLEEDPSDLLHIGGARSPIVSPPPHFHNQRENVQEEKSSVKKIFSVFIGIHRKIFGHSTFLRLKPQVRVDSLTNIRARVTLEGGFEMGGNRFEKNLKSTGFHRGASLQIKDTELYFEKGVPFSAEESGRYVDMQISQFFGKGGLKASVGRFSLDQEPGQNYGLFGHQLKSGMKVPFVQIPIFGSLTSGGDTKKFVQFIPEFLGKKEITSTSSPVSQQNLDQKQQFNLLRNDIKKSAADQINALRLCAKESRQFNQNLDKETRQFNEKLHVEHWKAEKGLHVQHWQAEKEFFSKQISPEQISSLQNKLLEQHKQVLTENACCADVNGLKLDHNEILKNCSASLKELIPFMGPRILLGFFGGALYIVSSDAALSLKKEGQEQSNPSLEYFSRTALAFSVLSNGLPSACILVVVNVSYNFLVGKPLNSRFFFLRSKSYSKLGQIFSKVFNQISSNRFSNQISLVGGGLSFGIRAGLAVSLMANAFTTALTIYEKGSIDPIEKVFCFVVRRGFQYAVLRAWIEASLKDAPESSSNSKDSAQ